MQLNKMNIEMQTQPDDTSCGPTSLHSVYHYYNHHVPLDELIPQINKVESGGTLAPILGLHALSHHFKCRIYTYNLDVFDPAWFYPRKLSSAKMIHKLNAQLEYKKHPKLAETTFAYIEYLKQGGVLEFKDLNATLLKKYFAKKIPLIVGLSATYLYKCTREYENDKGECIYDDLKGEPCGHFVVLCGYDEDKRHIVVADPHRENPISHDNYYKVNVGRLINAIMLGILTQDANILAIERE